VAFPHLVITSEDVMLRSRLLSPNPRLRACETHDAAHVKLGDQGEFVTLIQQALATIDNLAIGQEERDAARYGPSTAAAVLSYKTKRGIINRAYQTQPDSIVGKMTIKRLDEDMWALETHGTGDVSGGVLRPARGRIYNG
jgi:peptidoglycan hydrolase-like protein with peptidoglycan-binding domain